MIEQESIKPKPIDRHCVKTSNNLFPFSAGLYNEVQRMRKKYAEDRSAFGNG
jgi:hypothetical protein